MTFALALASFTLPISLNTANAGFFDFLFSSPQPAPSNYAPQPRGLREAHSHRFFHLRSSRRFAEHHPTRDDHRRATKQIVLRHPKWDDKDACCRSREAARPAPVLLDDESLREGDAVMTHSGIKVFTGDAGPHHKIDDFALVRDAGIPKRARKALLAMDPYRTGSSALPVAAGLTTGRSAAEPLVAPGAMIVDPKGNNVRYVGP
ncbi:hypothetical protein [Methylocapsa palsarum]|uniref:hypothetical protein n=1 Tax=Methylocapsa palsarum TaxID=1612308 RepID=UPI0011134097|nr:hypothetical protein [Methylocapsa palsarum]